MDDEQTFVDRSHSRNALPLSPEREHRRNGYTLVCERGTAIDAELDTIEMSEVFGGSPIIEKPKTEGE